MNSGQTVPQVFSAFERIRIVNLAHRKDRREEMRQQLSHVGLRDDHRVAFFPAVACDGPGLFQSRGAQGCFLSHIDLLKEAAASNSSILILEDDCDFLPAIFDYELPAGCDIFYGGYLSASEPSDLGRSDIIGSHFMGFSARAAQTAVTYFADYVRPDFIGDPRACAEPGYDPAIRPPIDGGYVWLRRAHPELVTVFAMLSAQRPSRSDIGAQRLFDRLPIVRDLAGFARRVRGKLSRVTRHHVSDNMTSELFWLGELPEFARSQQIPPIIHQTFPTKSLPPPLQRSVDRMRELNPGWEHRLHDERDCERLIGENYGASVLEVYRRINPDYGAARADLFRYLAVYALGGVYLDIKSYFSIPIDDVIDRDDGFVTAYWDNAPGGTHPGFGMHIDLKDFPRGELQQWHVMAARGHPLLRAVIAKVLSRIVHYRPWHEGVGRAGVLRITGPIAYTQAITPLLAQYPHTFIAHHEAAGLHYSIVGDYDHKAVFKRHYALHTTPIVALPRWAFVPAKLYGFLKERKQRAAAARHTAAGASF